MFAGEFSDFVHLSSLVTVPTIAVSLSQLSWLLNFLVITRKQPLNVDCWLHLFVSAVKGRHSLATTHCTNVTILSLCNMGTSLHICIPYLYLNTDISKWDEAVCSTKLILAVVTSIIVVRSIANSMYICLSTCISQKPCVQFVYSNLTRYSLMTMQNFICRLRLLLI